VALTWLGMRQQADGAWQRCEALHARRTVPHLVDGGSRLRHDTAAVALSGVWLESTREFAWSRVLPRWARAVIAQQPDSVRASLRLLDSVLLLTRAQRTDSTLIRIRRDIDDAATSPGESMRLARATSLFADARAAATSNGFPTLQAAIDSALALTRTSHELRRWIRLQRVNALLTSGREPAARDSLRQLLAEFPQERSQFTARLRNSRAMAAVALGEHARSLPLFQQLDAVCDTLALERCRLSAAAFTSEIAGLVGDDAGELEAGARIVKALAVSPVSSAQWSGLISLRRIAVANGYMAAAELLDGECVAIAGLLRAPALGMEALYQRSNDHVDRADWAAAAQDLREARERWLPQLPVAERGWYEPDMLRLEAEVVRGRDPQRSRVLMDSATRLLGDEANEFRRTTIGLSRARSTLASGDTAAALRDFDQLLASVSNRGGATMSVFERVRLGKVLWSAGQLAGEALRRLRQPRAALAAMSGRPFSAPGGGWQTIPPDSIHWYALRQVGDSIWVWSRGADSVTLRTVAVPSAVTVAATALDTVALGTLYDSLFAADLARPAPRRRVLQIEVQGPMAAVPWSAVYDRKRRRFLVELTALSLRDGAQGPSPSAASGRVPKRIALIDAAPVDRARALPGAAREIDSIAAVWGDRALRVDGGRGARPTLAELTRADIIHFAGHAILDRVRPERSYLLLPAASDSTIDATQIGKIGLARPSLVVLAGCETRGFALSRFAGFDSLAGAFLAAGAQSVIGAGWAVDDASTAIVMQRLHEALQAGQSPAEALRAAQVAAIRSANPAVRSPRTWAAFQIMGS
jgi:hypothetical protein